MPLKRVNGLESTSDLQLLQTSLNLNMSLSPIAEKTFNASSGGNLENGRWGAAADGRGVGLGKEDPW